MKAMSTRPNYKEAFWRIAHDLRNPLTIMRCHLDLLLIGKDKKAIDKDILKTIKILNKEIKRMTRILSEPGLNTKKK